MSETANSEPVSSEFEKPVQITQVKFPPFPDPSDEDFEEDIGEEERFYYKNKFQDLHNVTTARLHCTACDRHLGCSARNECRMRAHPMLRTLVCHTCHTFYNSGEFEKGDDGSELYCRWCGQGGQVYCCSNCPHVFCAKCIKRNLGAPKIKEIENTEDWKCFKCNITPLWDLRAICWALLRYCDLKNKITYKTLDPELKEAYQKDCGQDHSECCKSKNRRKEKLESLRRKDDRKELENSVKKSTASVISKIPPTIQVKKFASINAEDSIKQEKKAQKRPASPKNKIFIKNPITIASCPKLISPINISSVPKKLRVSNSPMANSIRFSNDRKPVPATYARLIRPKPPQIPIPIVTSSQYNGFNNCGSFNNMVVNDNINLSLESLTQGLDMAAVAAMANNSQDDDVVCTPDFPLEPLCEVTEDNTDDDVQCITPGPAVAPKITTPPPLVPRSGNILPDLSTDNIIQMTENDVTVNTTTGGLKLRVDPQTLSSSKMYRLPDGRIFAINANPNMPGGYSATIVAVTENVSGKVAPKGATFAAKLTAVTTQQVSTPPPLKVYRNQARLANVKKSPQNSSKVTKGTETSVRECDLNVPVEWYRYNLIDAVDALEYSLSRLHKLKKEATTMYLRTRSIPEMRNLHRTLERLLNTSSCRFSEIRENLNKGLKQYLLKKMGNNVSEDDDDVEILPDLDENDDPIFIDENSLESNANYNNEIESQEVDLTGLTNNEHNDSEEKIDKEESFSKTESDPLNNTDQEALKNEDENVINDTLDTEMTCHSLDKVTSNNTLNKISDSTNINNKQKLDMIKYKDKIDIQDERIQENKEQFDGANEALKDLFKEPEIKRINGDTKYLDEKRRQTLNKEIVTEHNDEVENTENEKMHDTEMSHEMIETLLKDDDGGDDIDKTENVNSLDITEIV